MDSGSEEIDDDTPSEPSVSGGQSASDGERVLLFMRPDRNRDLLVETLSDRYVVDTTTDVEALESTFDCCVFDAREFNRVAGTIQPRRELSSPVFLPFVLLVGDRSVSPAADNAWEYVDDVIDMPVRKTALRSRIANLVERRRTSLRLAERERKLAETVEDLRLKERAMDEAPVGITLAESGDDENPLVYTNAGFEALTGYGPDVFGADCRFLQGAETSAETRATVREAIDAERPISVDILNYRRNGQKFWNRLTVAPIRDDGGTVTHYVGFQTDITDRKIRERRLEVMGRVLNHNLRNKMNLVDGYTELLRRTLSDRGLDDEAVRRPLDVITATIDDLLGIAEAVRKIDRTLTDSATEPAVDLRDSLVELVGRMADRYPEATVELSFSDRLGSADSADEFDDAGDAGRPLHVAVNGLETAIEEGVKNAVKHNDGPHPSVAIRVERPAPDWVAIEIEDDGPGIPDHETRVLEHGETSLTHADRLGIWLMYWVVNKAGGDFSVSTGDFGTTLRLAVPVDP
jgi:PAS domain S-box-containing protein